MADSLNEEIWYKEFFTGPALELWRRAIPAERTVEEVRFLKQVLNVEPGASLLDVPAGNGRLSIPMALLGYKITSMDSSKEFSNECRNSSRNYKTKVDCVCADMRSIDWENKFDAAFCMGNSFGYFDRSGTQEFLKRLSRSLKEGAHFVLDTAMVAESFLVNGAEKEWVKAGDMHMLIENNYDCSRSCVRTIFTFIQGGKEEQRTAIHYIYTCAEICNMLESAGMEIVNLFESTDEDPFTLGSERLLLVALKK